MSLAELEEELNRQLDEIDPDDINLEEDDDLGDINDLYAELKRNRDSMWNSIDSLVFDAHGNIINNNDTSPLESSNNESWNALTKSSAAKNEELDQTLVEIINDNIMTATNKNINTNRTVNHPCEEHCIPQCPAAPCPIHCPESCSSEKTKQRQQVLGALDIEELAQAAREEDSEIIVAMDKILQDQRDRNSLLISQVEKRTEELEKSITESRLRQESLQRELLLVEESDVVEEISTTTTELSFSDKAAERARKLQEEIAAQMKEIEEAERVDRLKREALERDQRSVMENLIGMALEDTFSTEVEVQFRKLEELERIAAGKNQEREIELMAMEEALERERLLLILQQEEERQRNELSQMKMEEHYVRFQKSLTTFLQKRQAKLKKLFFQHFAIGIRQAKVEAAAAIQRKLLENEVEARRLEVIEKLEEKRKEEEAERARIRKQEQAEAAKKLAHEQALLKEKQEELRMQQLERCERELMYKEEVLVKQVRAFEQLERRKRALAKVWRIVSKSFSFSIWKKFVTNERNSLAAAHLIQRQWKKYCKTVQKQKFHAAVLLQAIVRTFLVKKRISKALETAKYNDEDDFIYEEVDVDAFLSAPPEMDEEWGEIVLPKSTQSHYPHPPVRQGGFDNVQVEEQQQQYYEQPEPPMNDLDFTSIEDTISSSRNNQEDEIICTSRKDEMKESLANDWGVASGGMIAQLLWKRRQKERKRNAAPKTRAKQANPMYRARRIRQSAAVTNNNQKNPVGLKPEESAGSSSTNTSWTIASAPGTRKPRKPVNVPSLVARLRGRVNSSR